MGSITDLEKYAKENKVPIISKDGLEFIVEIYKRT